MNQKGFCKLLLPLVIFLVNTGCSKKNPGSDLPPVSAGNNKTVGASANDILASKNYSSILIEFQYMEGYAPEDNAVASLVGFISSIVNKPGGITVIKEQIPAENRSTYSLNDIAKIEQQERTDYNFGDQIDVYILIIDGEYSDPSILGIAYRNTSVCLMGKTIFNSPASLDQIRLSVLETAIFEHEFGHLMGLVDDGSPMTINHRDMAHGNHCNNPHCLMYYQIESSGSLSFLGPSTEVPYLDSNCVADLRANGAK